MNDVLRLVRLSLILRVAVYAVSAIVSTFTLGWQVASQEILVAIPSIAFFIGLSWAERRHIDLTRWVQHILIGLAVIYAGEITVTTLLLDSLPPDVYQHPPKFVPPLVFAFVPAMLGAWVGGRRQALKWALFAASLSLICTVVAIQLAEPSSRVDWVAFATQASVLAPACYFIGVLADRMRDEHEQLEAASHQLLRQAAEREALASSRERLRMARNLHDTLAHTLAGLLSEIRLTRKLVETNPAAAADELQRAEAEAQLGLREARDAIGNLRANPAREMGLRIALQQAVEQFSQRTGVEATLCQSGDSAAFADERAETLYRIAEEALHNIELHAQATKVSVSLDAREEVRAAAATMSVGDDGVGFDVAAPLNGHYGLRGMREQAQLIGATFEARSATGRGTQIIIMIKE